MNDAVIEFLDTGYFEHKFSVLYSNSGGSESTRISIPPAIRPKVKEYNVPDFEPAKDFVPDFVAF